MVSAQSSARPPRAAGVEDEPVLGIIEGFYGRPWSWAARRRMLDFIAPLGYRMYVYAPKDEPLHRLQWRDPHFPEELRRFERLAQRSATLGIEFVFGIHPMDLRAEAADLGQLYDKARQLQQVGVASFCLLFDDLPGGAGRTDSRRAALARRQAGVANRLLERLRRTGLVRRLIVAPTEYHGLRRRSAYLRALGSRLAPEVDVFWTGPEVCSPTIVGSDVDRVSGELGRAPLIWDNYPVNDMEMRFDPHLRPVVGRSPEVRDRVRGLVANPANQSEASHVALHTLAAWWADPQAYDPERAWRAALEAVAGSRELAAALRALAELARRSPLEPGRYPVPVLEGTRRALGGAVPAAGRGGRVAALGRLEGGVEHWRRSAEVLLGSDANRLLRAELAPWSRKLLAWTDALDAALAALVATPDSREPARRRALQALAVARRSPYRVADSEMDACVRRLLWAASTGAASAGVAGARGAA